MDNTDLSKETTSSSDLNIDYSSETELKSKLKVNITDITDINFISSNSSSHDNLGLIDNKPLKEDIQIPKSETTESNSETFKIEQLFNSVKDTEYQSSNDDNLSYSTKESGTSTEEDSEGSLEKSSSAENIKLIKPNKTANIKSFTLSKNSNLQDSSSLDSSDTSNINLSNDNETMSNSESEKKELNRSIEIREVNENQRSVGINTDELVMTLKIPFDSSKIININDVNIHTSGVVSDNNFEKDKKKELEELKRTLMKKNEIKMQKMFESLLMKQNNDLEDEMFQFGIERSNNNINLRAINNQNSISVNSPKLDNLNVEDIIKNNDNKIDSPVNEIKNEDEEDSPNRKRKKEIEDRKMQIKAMVSQMKVEQKKENNINSDSNPDSDLSSKNSNSNEENDEKPKNDDYEKRKELRKQRFLQRRGVTVKKNILNSVFNMIYIINMKEDSKRAEPLLRKLSEQNIKYQIVEGVNAKDSQYMKYTQRWLNQTDEEKYPLNKVIFEHQIYLKKNPDLEAKGLTNKTRLWNHWITSGKAEGRSLYGKTNIQNIYQLGCLLAHNKIYLDAKKNDYKNILILEDDIYLDDNFLEKFNDIHSQIPSKWDLLYFGAVQKKWDDLTFNKNYYYAKETLGAFAYGISNSYFDYLYNISMELVDPIDKCLEKIQKLNNSYVIYPNLIISNLDRSKIHRSRDINFYSKVFKWDLDNFDIEIYDDISETNSEVNSEKNT